ncbi:MAG: SDR family NAD(P)-dependent oxidoreductase [Rickettsiales bacterium]
MKVFSGQSIWLIGASEGIGAALAQRLAEAGAELVLSARNADALHAVAAALPGTHRVVPCDVTDPTSVAAAWQSVSGAGRPLDRVIYNAGAYEPMDAAHFDRSKIARMVDVNFNGALNMLAWVLPDFMARNAGHIALVGSVAGYRGLPAALGYGASKAALIHLAENLRADLARTNIQVQIINPGFVKTRLTDRNDFTMPCIITPERAADYIVRGLQQTRFEIDFPKRFSRVMKLLSLLPYGAYFWLLRQVKWSS